MGYNMICTGGPNGDQCCPYNVVMDRRYTVEELVKEIVATTAPNEWGKFEVRTVGKAPVFTCKFSQNQLEKNIPDKVGGQTVVKAAAYGGWSLMDYYIDAMVTQDLGNRDRVIEAAWRMIIGIDKPKPEDGALKIMKDRQTNEGLADLYEFVYKGESVAVIEEVTDATGGTLYFLQSNRYTAADFMKHYSAI